MLTRGFGRGYLHTPWRAACAFVVSVMWVGSIGAVSALAPISQQFLTSDNLSLGALVSLKDNSTEDVEAASTSNTNNLIGVVITSGSSPITLSTNQANQVQVATSGVVPVLVSNINGSISVGDQITASPIVGVGMKATSNTKVVGIAQGDLSSSGNSQQQSYTDKAGQKHTVILGQVPVLVNVAYYFKQPDKTLIPSALQNLANTVAGKPVNTLPIIISAVIFIVTLVVVMTLIYTLIHGSIISVGRNPMAQAAVYRNMIQLSGLVVLILGVGVAAMYLVLTKL